MAKRTNKQQLADIDQEINTLNNQYQAKLHELEMKRSELNGIVRVHNKYFTNIFNIAEDSGDYDHKVQLDYGDWSNPKIVLKALDIIEKNAKELRELIKNSKKIEWYGGYHYNDEDK